MINSLSISQTGMSAMQMRVDVISNNLANVQTPGFKRADVHYQDQSYQNLRQVGAAADEQNQLPTGLQLGLGVRAVATSRQFTQGGVEVTDDQLHVMVNGAGFLQVTMPDGTTGYTRDGSLKLGPDGRLVTSGGLPIAGDITVPAEAQNISISADGIVSVKLPGNPDPQQIGNIELASFVNPAGLEPMGQNLYVETVASGAPNAGAPGTGGLGALKQGQRETSNVNVVQELVTMIQAQRAYEMNSKAIQTSDQMLQRLSQL